MQHVILRWSGYLVAFILALNAALLSLVVPIYMLDDFKRKRRIRAGESSSEGVGSMIDLGRRTTVNL